MLRKSSSSRRYLTACLSLSGMLLTPESAIPSVGDYSAQEALLSLWDAFSLNGLRLNSPLRKSTSPRRYLTACLSLSGMLLPPESAIPSVRDYSAQEALLSPWDVFSLNEVLLSP
ncbi:hypothetical protein BgiBS90_031079 [Biomphalaria glabrata]|nr:hypothetical protein BgiBS90_031079 [Biomphalaria glabrata]